MTGAVNAVLELDRIIVEWSADTLQSDEPDRARATLRSMIVRLGELAELGARDPRALLAPFVDALLDLRERARAGKDFALSDAVRERLEAAGIEVRDTPEGVTWEPRVGTLGSILGLDLAGWSPKRRCYSAPAQLQRGPAPIV